jgi:para-aminobenzoate synthetase/4-amino-4-deoxychorismate lyase
MAPDGDAQFNVAIRTVLIDRQATDVATGRSVARAEYGVGGGVIWDSSMKGEWEECATKARILTMRRPSFQLLETLRWTRDDGYALLAQHLARLVRSADYFDFAVDSDAIMGRLRTVAQEFTADAYRLRLLLSKDGSLTLETAVLEMGNERRARRVCLAPTPVNSADVFLYHKTTNRGFYEEMMAACPAYDDVILWNKKGEITESCLANVVTELDGELVTPPVSCGLLAGTYRAWMLQQGLIRERVVHREDLQRCTGLWLVNSVRGKLAARIEDTAPALETI